MQVQKWRTPALVAGAAALLAVGLIPGVVDAGPSGEAPPAVCDDHDKTGAIVSGPKGKKVVTGTEGDDRILVTGRRKKVYGLGGNDTICYRGTDAPVFIDGGPGADYIFSNNFAGDTIYGGADNDVIHSTGGDDQVFGDDGDDRVFGGDGLDRITGGPGADTLRGGAGDDVIDGVTGPDRCFGDTEADSSSACEFNESVEYARAAPPEAPTTTTTTTTAPAATTTTAPAATTTTAAPVTTPTTAAAS